MEEEDDDEEEENIDVKDFELNLDNNDVDDDE